MDRMKKMPILRLYPNLSPPEVHLMACVMQEPDGRTVSSLTKAMDMPMSAVSRLMRGMEERGLIARSILPQDRRSVLVRVTPEGERLLDEFQVNFHAFFEEMIHVGDPGRFDQAIEGWNQLLDRMEALLLARPAPEKNMTQPLPLPPDCVPEDMRGRGGVSEDMPGRGSVPEAARARGNIPEDMQECDSVSEDVQRRGSADAHGGTE